MNRKIISPNQALTTRDRTTIYLPNTIHLTKPTAEINKQLQHLHVLQGIVTDRTRYINFYQVEIAHSRSMKNTKGYQIVIHEQYNNQLQSIENQTGLTISQIINICFILNC
jgi:hypothetical protein